MENENIGKGKHIHRQCIVLTIKGLALAVVAHKSFSLLSPLSLMLGAVLQIVYEEALLVCHAAQGNPKLWQPCRLACFLSHLDASGGGLFQGTQGVRKDRLCLWNTGFCQPCRKSTRLDTICIALVVKLYLDICEKIFSLYLYAERLHAQISGSKSLYFTCIYATSYEHPQIHELHVTWSYQNSLSARGSSKLKSLPLDTSTVQNPRLYWGLLNFPAAEFIHLGFWALVHGNR